MDIDIAWKILENELSDEEIKLLTYQEAFKRVHLQDAIRQYLDNLHVTLWLDWDITQSRSRRRAEMYVEKLFNEIETVQDHVLQQHGDVNQGRLEL